MQMSPLKIWDWVILQHVYTDSFLMRMTVTTQNYTIFYYAWTGIMHQGKQFCGTHVLRTLIK